MSDPQITDGLPPYLPNTSDNPKNFRVTHPDNLAPEEVEKLRQLLENITKSGFFKDQNKLES